MGLRSSSCNRPGAGFHRARPQAAVLPMRREFPFSSALRFD
jgi:hypothetical protein